VTEVNRLFSFLGVNEYSPCFYERGLQIATETPFFQFALQEFLKSDGYDLDEIVLFATRDAQAENGEKFISELRRKKISTSYRFVTIPDTVSGQDLWDVFEFVYNEIHIEDRIFFDITHGFRSFPIAVLPMLFFARELKQIDVGGIFYGNYESRVERNGSVFAPMDDLTDVLSFLNWTHGVNTFLTTGNADPIVDLVRQDNRRERQAGIEKNTHDRSKQIALTMKSFHRSMATCRGVSFSQYASKLMENVNDALDDGLSYRKPLGKLLEKVQEKMVPFSGDRIMDPYYAVLWCIEHGLIQQAYTMLHEHVITVVCLLVSEDSTHPATRQRVSSSILNVSSRGKEGRDAPRELTQRVSIALQPYDQAYGTIDALRKYRNDLNHAETTHGSAKPERIENRISEFADALGPIFLAIKDDLTQDIKRQSLRRGD